MVTYFQNTPLTTVTLNFELNGYKNWQRKMCRFREKRSQRLQEDGDSYLTASEPNNLDIDTPTATTETSLEHHDSTSSKLTPGSIPVHYLQKDKDKEEYEKWSIKYENMDHNGQFLYLYNNQQVTNNNARKAKIIRQNTKVLKYSHTATKEEGCYLSKILKCKSINEMISIQCSMFELESVSDTMVLNTSVVVLYTKHLKHPVQPLDYILNNLPRNEVVLGNKRWIKAWPALIRVLREIDFLSHADADFNLDDEPDPEVTMKQQQNNTQS
ncbi:hypothetical protein BDA99DRAFT_563228 [Phascolomyces articulosus]|uniref:Uncharacterized protein n=1 Tax=Phascolomyces articulosus TaxID=60185 RepID=A0AAD5K3R1_9FUNG|nr:hypothetical protein BDA99DRAFT_563228 [Phascolomyces articulosus]